MTRTVVLFLICFIFSISSCSYIKADTRENIYMPSAEELHCMHFDHRGLLWLGTSSGIKTYDGYRVRNEFVMEIPVFPQLISDIYSITTDHDNHLWAGTNNGLLRMDLNTGNIKHYSFPKPSQQIIYKLFTSANGTLYVGTDDGFSIYNANNDTFRHYNQDNSKAIYPDGKTGKYKGWGVKDFVETKQGDIIIGTWGQGLWKFNPKTKKIHGYEKLNWMNSAFSLCLDNKGKLWIGTQCVGVQTLDNTNDYTAKNLSFAEKYKEKKIVYDILPMADGEMMVCSDDTISALKGPDGALWLATRENGITRILYGRSLFRHHATGSIRSIFTDNGSQFLLGYGMTGLAWTDITNNGMTTNRKIPGYSGIPNNIQTRVTSIVKRFNGDIWAAAGDNGIFIKHPDQTSETLYPHSRKMPYVKDNVMTLYEDPRSNTLWIGQRKGVSILLANGEGRYLDIKTDSADITGYFMVNNITSDHNGNIWVASANRGIVRITGNLHDPKSIHAKRVTAPFSNITACYEDSRHRIWAICSRGLLAYETDTDRFTIANESFHIADRAIMAINEDIFGCLWLATDKALVRLDENGNTISFTEQDGLPSTSFFANSTFKYGERLFFGTSNGFVDFVPSQSYDNYRKFKSSIVVTDILIDGTSIQLLDSANMMTISTMLPMATKEITIPAYVRKFSVEFALLNYANQQETRYAYKLDGYDDDWQYIDGTTHCATFEHIPAGKYTFHLKAADSHGHWNEMSYSITVRVKSPWYDTWWAYLLYIMVVATLVRFIWNYIQMKRETEASRRFSSILESAQIQKQTECCNSSNDTADQQQKEIILSAQALRAQAEQQRDAQFIAKATQLVNDNLANAEYNRESMAADLNMSVSTLYGRMRDCTGLSIQTFIQTIRLNAAAEILKTSPDIRINELAYRVGFNTPKYFSQCFKKKFGVLPGEYVK